MSGPSPVRDVRDARRVSSGRGALAALGGLAIERIGAGLAFAEAVPELEAALASSRCVVVQAPPGSGKTTLVPAVVAQAVARGHDDAGGQTSPTARVVVTSPRRLTARSGAARLASLSGTAVGEMAGYTVRGDRAVGADTLVEFVTPGVLLQRLLRNPELPGVAAVVVDEVHERSLDADLALAMLAEVAQLRDDLLLVAMSATLDSERFARVLGGDDAHVPVVACEAQQFPLEVGWAPFAGPRTDARGVARGFLDHVAQVAAQALADGAALDSAYPDSADPEDACRDGSVLVFVPGAWEVDQVVASIRARVGDSADVLPLHGRLTAAEQDAALAPQRRPRVVVSTSVAESSLTVPGVRVVVDSGLAREPRRDAARGMSGLVTVAASQESAVQRAGRAARLGPGRVVRCYDEATYLRMRAAATPQIATADLTQAALYLAAWGSPRGEGLRLLDQPPAAALAAATRTLAELGAVDDSGRITAEGQALAALPVDPRHGRALLLGAPAVGARRAAEVVAALADDSRSPETDIAARLRAWSGSGRHSPAGVAWRRESDRLRRAAEAAVSAPSDPSAARTGSAGAAGSVGGVGDPVGLVVALAHPDRVARRVGADDATTYLLASGTRAALPPEAGSLRGAEWLAVAEVTRAHGRRAAGTGAVIRSAAALHEADAMSAAEHLLSERTEARLAGGRVSARRIRALGAIELSAAPIAAEPEHIAAAVREALDRDGLGVLAWSESAESLRRRLHLLHSVFGAPWPDVTDTGLLERRDDWLDALLTDRTGGGGPSLRIDAGLLRGLVPWPEAGRIDELAPEALPVASSARIRLQYPPVPAERDTSAVVTPGDRAASESGGRVIAAVKLQECFGMATSPLLADGRVRVQFHLLSPARRPLAVTDDLASFWNGAYRQVRAEMRGRYPKHPWPEDPWTAPATAATRRAT
ncbi:MAG: ATP-dependent helicase HrpB [Dermatophilus congolensis]|nr:ATP-dependent helicase HrpB [Dermatophilus congolensis]